MRDAIRFGTMLGLLLVGASAAATETGATSVGADGTDTRTAAQRSFDATEEARDATALQSLKARVEKGAPAASSSQESTEPAEPVLFMPMTPALQEAALAPLRSAGVVPADAPLQSTGLFLMRDCYHFLFSFPDSGRPPRYHLLLVRVPAPLPECTSASREIDSSYVGSFQVAVKGGHGMAVASQSKQTPSGSGLVHVRLFQIEPKNLEIVRQEFLGTYLGSTWVDAMHFEGNRLVVETNRYTATYPRFLTSELPPQGVIFP